MPDLVDKGARWLAGHRAVSLIRPVVYHPRGGSPAPVNATIGRTEVDTVTATGVVERVESRDFIIGSEFSIDPARGDRIIESDGTTQWTYEVLALPGRSNWQWADASRTARRVHTKLILTESIGG
jgi:hypothetical protein